MNDTQSSQSPGSCTIVNAADANRREANFDLGEHTINQLALSPCAGDGPLALRRKDSELVNGSPSRLRIFGITGTISPRRLQMPAIGGYRKVLPNSVGTLKCAPDDRGRNDHVDDPPRLDRADQKRRLGSSS
jgi:hypothetical protein